MMEETKELKQEKFIGYRIEDDNTYSLVDFKSNEILDTMSEVSILYDGDVLLKHGHPDKIDWRSQYLRKLYNEAGIPNDIHIVKGKIPIVELDKMLTITGYIPK